MAANRHGDPVLDEDGIAALVEQRAHATEFLARQHHVAGLQRATLDEQSRHGAAALLDARLEHEAHGGTVRDGLEFQHLGHHGVHDFPEGSANDHPHS